MFRNMRLVLEPETVFLPRVEYSSTELSATFLKTLPNFWKLQLILHYLLNSVLY